MTTRPTKVSVVIGARNEHPQILATIFSFIEEFEYWGYPYEIIVVDNMSDDNTPHILRDKMRRWVREKKLKIIEYNDKPANVTVRNIGAREATGDVVFLSDAHVTIKPGTCHGMIQGWLERGGLWHSAINIWGDTSDIKCYGYDLRLIEKFWGNLSRGVPKELEGKDKKPRVPYYRVPMASHCCLMAGREQYLDFGGYCEAFKCYGGGEPYLDLLWWLFGSEVFIYAKGLIRHAFGLRADWREVKKDTKTRTRVHKKDRTHDTVLKKGESHLHYSRGYAWKNDWMQHNFLLSAYCIGGYSWMHQRYEDYFERRKGNSRYIADIQKIRAEVIKNGSPTRKFIKSRQICTLDELVGHDCHGNVVESPGKTKPWCNFEDL
jgi:glycosyltransferase involved in cell wall biosynthesis